MTEKIVEIMAYEEKNYGGIKKFREDGQRKIRSEIFLQHKKKREKNLAEKKDKKSVDKVGKQSLESK